MGQIVAKRQYHFEDGRLIEDLPTIFRCDCGHLIQLLAFTNTCMKCDQDYNQAGQRLAPRSQWGEETGESPGDILNIGHHIG